MSYIKFNFYVYILKKKFIKKINGISRIKRIGRKFTHQTIETEKFYYNDSIKKLKLNFWKVRTLVV